MNKLMDWMKGKFMKYHISDKEYDMIQADMQEENRNSLLFFSVITILFLIVMLLISFCFPVFVRYRSAYILLMLIAVLILAGAYISKIRIRQYYFFVCMLLKSCYMYLPSS